MTFDPYNSGAHFCVGREALVEKVIRGAFDRRVTLLFGGRQSGKTTILRLAESLYANKTADAFKLDEIICPVYVNLTDLPVDATPREFYQLLLGELTVCCQRQVINYESGTLNFDFVTTIDEFAREIKEVTKRAGQVSLKLLFLVDESGRVLGERFPRGFQDNLFSLLYGDVASNRIDIAFVFAGAQELYKFSEDDTSPIGSRASYAYTENLTKENVLTFLQVVNSQLGLSVPEVLSASMHRTVSGHPGLTSRLLSAIETKKIADESALQAMIPDFVNENKQLFRLWGTSLSREARRIHDLLIASPQVSRKQIAQAYLQSGWDPLLFDRGLEELAFTGIAFVDVNGVTRDIPIYWDYVESIIGVDQHPVDNSATKVALGSESGKSTWPLIGAVELTLRALIRDKYREKYGANLEQKGLQVLGASANKVRANLEKSKSRFKYSRRTVSLDCFDGMYFSQLVQLMLFSDNWELFSPIFKDKRELEVLAKPISAVRTDEAHFLPTPERELARCRMHCEDLLSLLAKHGIEAKF